MTMIRRRCFAMLSAGLFFCSLADAGHAQVVEWIRQLGTSSDDSSDGVSADGLGNVYMSGTTQGSLDGANAGGRDAFVSKYDAEGALQWTRQLGTSDWDESFGVSADGLGNVYISGSTSGSLDGPNAGGPDAFVAKYNADGNIQWIRQLGTLTIDYGRGVSADGLGNVYISGATLGNLSEPHSGEAHAGAQDVFVSKYNDAGNLQWTRQLGTPQNEYATAVSADGLGNVYISGFTHGDLGGPFAGFFDGFVSKYDAGGNHQWTRQFGTASDDYYTGVSADGLGNVYVSGYTGQVVGSLDEELYGPFVTKYDATGNIQWTRKFGINSFDLSNGVSVDGLGNVYISGKVSEGVSDAYVSKFDADGNLQWSQRHGSDSHDESTAVSADGYGNVYISGRTLGSLGGPHAGDHDAFVAKVIEPDGDFDGDDDVDGNDFLVWQRGGAPGGLSAAGLVEWKATFGTGALTTQHPVPEPAAAALAALAIAAGLALRSRHTPFG